MYNTKAVRAMRVAFWFVRNDWPSGSSNCLTAPAGRARSHKVGMRRVVKRRRAMAAHRELGDWDNCVYVFGRHVGLHERILDLCDPVSETPPHLGLP